MDHLIAPAPASGGGAPAGPAPYPGDPLAARLADVLAAVVERDDVPLGANFFADLGADSMVMARFCARVRKQPGLPAVTIKDVYRHPTVAALAAALAPPAAPPVGARLSEVLAGVLHVDDVPPEADFFADLGADSMVMAQFCARVRKQPDLPPVSIKDVYEHRTLAGLASSLTVGSATAGSAPVETAPATPDPVPLPRATPATRRQYLLCGGIQLAIFCAYAYVIGIVFEKGLTLVWAAHGLLGTYARSVAWGAAVLVTTAALPIIVKWVLVGRWKAGEVAVWSPAYIRFWLVRTLVIANPLVLFAGSPLYSLYLRALGAKVGRDVVVFSRHAPVCTDLLTIGDGTVIEKDTYLNCYRAVNGVVQTGPVTIGADVFVGDQVVLDIHTSIGDGAQLGHASALHAGQTVPPGEHWHGSPGQRTESDYRLVDPAPCSTWRRLRYASLQLLVLLGGVLPAAFGGIALVLEGLPWLSKLVSTPELHVMNARFWLTALISSLVLVLIGPLIGMLVVMTVPRLLNRALAPGRTYPLFGIRFACHRAVERITNRKLFHLALGDTSYVVPYVQALGYRLAPVVQTGSNFGEDFKHDNPFLSTVGPGTVIASGMSFVTTNYSNTSFSVSPAAIGANNFLGNRVVYPSQGRTGDNCLIATKALVPLDGPVRQDVGLLGSPAFEIPRTVRRDSVFVRMAHDEEFPRRLAAKNRHNRVSIGLLVLSRWVYTFALLVFTFSTVDLYPRAGGVAIAGLQVALVVFSILYFSLVERLATLFRGCRPTYCSIYDPTFWRTERFWKLVVPPAVHRLTAGTPFRGLVWRLVGVRVGRQLFDDGASMSEKNLVTLGDHVTLNVASHIQCHSQEDYAFKSEHSRLGSYCTLGTNALVHYGVTMHDGSVLAADSFLMKGEEVPAGELWGGNPAEAMSATPPPTRPAGPAGGAAAATSTPSSTTSTTSTRATAPGPR